MYILIFLVSFGLSIGGLSKHSNTIAQLTFSLSIGCLLIVLVPFLGLVSCSICLFSVPKRLCLYSFFLFFMGVCSPYKLFRFSLSSYEFVLLCFSVGLNFYQLHLLVVFNAVCRWPPSNNVPSFYFFFTI